MTKKVLVTGGAGFIGSHITDALVEEGHHVRILDNLDLQVHQGKVPSYLNADAEFIKGDIRNEDDIRAAIHDIEAIFHQAAVVGIGQSMYEIRRYTEVNVYGTAKLLDILANEKNRVEKVITASSMSIYGEGKYTCAKCSVVYPFLREKTQLEGKQWEMLCPHCGKIAVPVPTDETKPLYPTSIYAITKRDQEEMTLVFGRAYRIPAVSLRYFNTYGPRQSLSNPYTGICAIFSSRLKNSQPPLIFEDGMQSRDFTSVHDIVQANLLALNSPHADYEVFNVGTAKPTTVIEIAQKLGRLYGKDIAPEILGKFRAGDIRHCYGDITKIQKKIGFKPEVDLEKGLGELIRWVESEPATDAFAASRKELEDKGLITG